MSCQSPLFWWHSSWGCRGGCSQASGHSGWCWAQAWLGRAAPCIAAGQTSGWGWVRRHGSWYFGVGRTGYMKASQIRGRGGCGTWSDALGELQMTDFSNVSQKQERHFGLFYFMSDQRPGVHYRCNISSQYHVCSWALGGALQSGLDSGKLSCSWWSWWQPIPALHGHMLSRPREPTKAKFWYSSKLYQNSFIVLFIK